MKEVLILIIWGWGVCGVFLLFLSGCRKIRLKMELLMFFLFGWNWYIIGKEMLGKIKKFGK